MGCAHSLLPLFFSYGSLSFSFFFLVWARYQGGEIHFEQVLLCPALPLQTEGDFEKGRATFLRPNAASDQESASAIPSDAPCWYTPEVHSTALLYRPAQASSFREGRPPDNQTSLSAENWDDPREAQISTAMNESWCASFVEEVSTLGLGI